MMGLKNYDNLYRLYLRSRKKQRIAFFICLALFILSAATFIIDGFPFEVSLIMMAMIFPAILFGIILLVSRSRTLKSMETFSPSQLTAINREIPSCPMYEGLFAAGEAVVGTKLGGLQLVPVKNILWVYTNVTVEKLNGIIPIYKYTALILADRDHKQYSFRIKNDQKAFFFIQSELLKSRLDLVFGYERGMDDIYKNDINRLISFSLECAEKRRREWGI